MKQRTDTEFDKFWDKVVSQKPKANVGEPGVPCKRQVLRFEITGTGDSYVPQTPKQHFRIVYFADFD